MGIRAGIRFLSLSIEHLLGNAYKNGKLKTFKPHHISATSFKTLSVNEVALIPHILKVPKSSIDKKLRKKKIPSSSNPKSSKNVRQSKPKKIVDDSHNTKESVATADATKILEASESAEELRNQPKPADTKKIGNVNLDELLKDHKVNEEAEESPFDTESEIKLIGKENVDQEMHDAADTTLIGDSHADQEMEEAHSDLESMPDDEIMFVSRNDDEDDDSKELSMADEIAADNLIEKLISVANTRDANTNVFAATDLPISTVSASTSTIVTSPRDVQALIVKVVWEKKNIPRVKIPNDTLLETLTNAVRDTLLGFQHQIKKAIKKQMPKVVIKPLYKEFNALSKLEIQRFVILQKKLSKSMRETVGKYVMKNVKSQIREHLQTKVEKTSADLHELVELVPQLVRIVDSVAPPVNAAIEGEKKSQAQPDPAIETSNDDILKQVMPFMEEGGLAPNLPNLPNLHHFKAVGEGPMTLEESKIQM
ncbi:hypothetical protein Tco_1313997 [Tanacetum coccineum]